MKTWIKSNSSLAHAVDVDISNYRTVCGVELVGKFNALRVPDENQPKCKKCLKY